MARGNGLRNVAFAQMDAARLGFPSETFDVVLANFVGWDYCFDFERMAFTGPDLWGAEIRRVLKPGGQVGIGSWIEQRDIEWIVGAIRRYLPEHISELDSASGGRMLAYGKENPEGIETVLREGGFGNIHIHVETVEVISPDEETWWRQMKQAASDYFKHIPGQESDIGRWFKEQVFADLKPYRLPGGIYFSKTVQYGFGTK